MTKSIHKILIITVLFSVALSLGLENIKSDYNYLKSIDNDAYIYIELAENGLDAVSADHRSTRLLIPVSAFYLSKINFFKGKYNKPQTNLFLVSFIFFVITVFTLHSYVKENFSGNTSLFATGFFFLNFYVINQYFYGYPDTAEFLFSLLLIVFLTKEKYIFLIPLFFLAAFNRESFILFALPVISVWSLFIEDNLQRYKCILFGILGSAIFLSIIYLIKANLQINIEMFIDRTTNLFNINKFFTFLNLDNLRNLLYYTFLLVPIGLLGLYRSKRLFFSAVIVILVYLIIGAFFVGSGAAIGRYIFSSAGPMLIIGQALFFMDYIEKRI